MKRVIKLFLVSLLFVGSIFSVRDFDFLRRSQWVMVCKLRELIAQYRRSFSSITFSEKEEVKEIEETLKKLVKVVEKISRAEEQFQKKDEKLAKDLINYLDCLLGFN